MVFQCSFWKSTDHLKVWYILDLLANLFYKSNSSLCFKTIKNYWFARVWHGLMKTVSKHLMISNVQRKKNIFGVPMFLFQAGISLN